LPKIDEVKRAFGADASKLEFVEDGEVVAVRSAGGKWLDKKKWDELNGVVRDVLGGRYSPEHRCWLVELEAPIMPASEMPKRSDGRVDVEAYAGLKSPLAQDEVLWIELGKLKPNRYNPNEMSEEEFQALLDNMRKEGPNGTDPILIRPLGADWEIIDGFHRFKAAGVLAWPKIRCMVRRVDEDRAQEINYAKNKLRGSINPWKEAELFEASRKKGLTQKAIADKFGVTQPYVADRLSLLKIDPTVRQIIPRGINVSLLELLARLDDPVKQKILANRIVHPQGCTVKEAEELFRTLQQPATPPAAPATISATEPTVVLVGPTEHYGKTTVPLAAINKVKAVVRPDVTTPSTEWRVEYRDAGVVISQPITEECGLELEKLGVHVERIEVAPPTPQPPVRVAEVVTTPTPIPETPTQPSAEDVEPPRQAKPREIDLDATHRFCPICGDPMTVTAYERLKKKFESVTVTVASLFKGAA
jgi:ParB family chromosome partitioning protein